MRFKAFTSNLIVTNINIPKLEKLTIGILLFTCLFGIESRAQNENNKKEKVMEYQSLSPNIGVNSVNETVKFYTEMLGFNLIMSTPETGDLAWAMVGSGNVTLMFQEEQSLKDEYPQLKERTKNSVLTFYVKLKGMSELYEKLKNTKYLVKELNKTSYGAEEFAIFDNNGYILTITEAAQ